VGTASLVFGFIAIGFGVLIAYDALANSGGTVDPGLNLLFGMGLAIILLGIGGLLLRKYDRDRKKEKVQG